MKITKHGFAVLSNDTHIGFWAEQEGRLDHDQNCLPKILEFINEGDVVIDAGAFIGDHTIAYAIKVGEEGKVIAFEPNREAYDCLKYNMKKYPQVQCLNIALSMGGTYRVVSENNNEGMAYLVEGGDVEGLSIDSIMLDRLDFIKIDCEGYELEVLKGAEKTINNFNPKMLIEINDATLNRKGVLREEIYTYLDSLGYYYRNIYPEQGLGEEQLDIIAYKI